ncbi:hypothetical protein Gogos_005882, partial [Gossypium gossypioides]|nr:hypothetical protein [Gossypium gossypioides]
MYCFGVRFSISVTLQTREVKVEEVLPNNTEDARGSQMVQARRHEKGGRSHQKLLEKSLSCPWSKTDERGEARCGLYFGKRV